MPANKTPVRRLPPAERRAAIDIAAREIASTEGLSNMTLRAVAAQAGMTPALVAHYIPSMDDLVVRTFLSVVQSQLDQFRQLIVGKSAIAQLSIILATPYDGTHDDLSLVWAESWVLARRSEGLANAILAESGRWIETLESVISKATEEGIAHVVDSEVAALQILSLIDGTNSHTLVRWGSMQERLSILEHAVERILGVERGELERARTPANDSP